MRSFLAVATLIAMPLITLLVSALTYALRDLSKVRLAEELGKRAKDHWYEPTLDHAKDLSFITGALRMFCNLLVLLALIDLFRNLRGTSEPDGWEYLCAVIVASIILVLTSLALPRAIATHMGEELIARFVVQIHGLRTLFSPVTALMHFSERLVVRTRPRVQTALQAESLAEEEILDAVSEGEDAGVVDDRQRALIERVMEFRSATVDDVMTTRKDIVALSIEAPLGEILKLIERSGHSRVPIYSGTIDKIVGVLYARDLLRHLDGLKESFDIRSMLRLPLYVPRTKPLRDLLQDFRLQKIHIAIVLDEYGGTAGLITIEDVIEQLVGEISDEHEPLEPTMYKRLDDNRAECDARIQIEDLNRLLGMDLPEDEEYETLAGFVTKTLDRIPSAGATFEANGARFTILESEPSRVVRVRIDLLNQSPSR
jgi:CBS domain containing-hemolysin-like protein